MKVTLLLLVLIAFVIYACTTQTAQGNFTNIDVAAFKEKMSDSSVVILDVRTPTEVAAGKIAEAQVIDIKGGQFAQQIQQLDTTKTYLVYCRSGRRSAKACSLMEQAGFEKLYNLKGGYLAWKKAN
ncbi:MAG: rhodanese-like domain-containing protein [Saprospiraceae bacterium]